MSRQQTNNLRAQMGFVPEARPFGIYRLARTINLQMADAYGERWFDDQQQLHMAYLLLALQLRRCGIASETRLSLDGAPRLYLGEWIIKMGEKTRLHACSPTSARRRLGKPMFTAVDVAQVYAWAKRRDLDVAKTPVMSEHVRNKDRVHADVIARKTVQIRRVV